MKTRQGTVQRREDHIEDLARRGRLWPLIDHHTCRMCAMPRREDRGYPTCYGCKDLNSRYHGALYDLMPITYTTPKWALGIALRAFKDAFDANPRHRLALRMGAVMSAYLEAQMPRLCVTGFDAVIPVPSSKPAVVSALTAAQRAGWWTPTLRTDLATADPKFPRQRTRDQKQRRVIEDKWQIQPGALLDTPEVLILDDMCTTGGTLHSFARALKVAGANRVTAVVLARNVGADDGEWIRPLLKDRLDRGRLWTPRENKRDVLR